MFSLGVRWTFLDLVDCRGGVGDSSGIGGGSSGAGLFGGGGIIGSVVWIY